MAVTEQQFEAARKRAEATTASAGRVTSARFDPNTGSVILEMDTGIGVSIPAHLVEGLRGASPGDLAEVSISPSGLGLHWSRLDADLYVPAALIGYLGAEQWMAAVASEMGARGGSVRSVAKAAAARANGLRGGRPKKAKAPLQKKAAAKKKPRSKIRRA